ncbi:MAG: MCE family protein [Bdellovibrionales bacterium]|nr:MCE family protein [Bdellovibrionales bacterium]
MKIKFNKFERVAGLFVVVSCVGAVILSVGVAIKRGWLASKIQFNTVLKNAEGIHVGTPVKISGLRAGSVYAIELVDTQEIHVRFEVLEKFHSQIRQDSNVLVVRPFIIGDKVIDVTVGNKTKPVLNPGEQIVALPTYDIMDIMSGRKLGPVVDNLEKIMGNLQILVEAFADKKRAESMVRLFDKLEPLVENMNEAAQGFQGIAWAMNRKKNMFHLMNNISALSIELNTMLPEMKQEVPHLGQRLGQLMNDVQVLASEFKKLTPALSAIAPELPRASKKAVQALDEVVITLKAMQGSFLFSGGAREAREETKDEIVKERERLVNERMKLEAIQRSLASEKDKKEKVDQEDTNSNSEELDDDGSIDEDPPTEEETHD